MSSTTNSPTNDVEIVVCSGCGKRQDPSEEACFATCSGCHRARYHSRDCQATHWPQHKQDCAPDIIQEFWRLVEQAKDDYAITDDENKLMQLTVNRVAGFLNCRQGANIGSNSHENVQAAVCFVLDRRLYNKGRGVRLVDLPNKKKQHNNKVAHVVNAIGSPIGHKRIYQVKLIDSGETLKVKPSQMHLLPLNDSRHWQYALEYKANPERVFPPETDPEWCNRQLQYIPVTPGYKWEYQDVDGEWKEYNEFIQYEIEVLYDMGAEHFLYRPGAPHCEGIPVFQEGSGPSIDATLPLAGDVFFLNAHDASTNQIVFSEQTENHKPIMTERFLFTGFKRRVRRSGPLPPAENDYTGRRNFYGQQYHYKDNAENNGTFCGLCESTRGPFIQTECCGNWVCDTEGQYEIGSYEREGQCHRNHRYGSICAWHHQEDHDGDWKECQRCVDDFHPYDYAVKASSQGNSGTVRRYNFENNCRHDLDLTTIEFPTCFECKEPVDTTEETTRTIMMRDIQGGGKVFCKFHGGGFGVIKIDPGSMFGGR